MNWIKSTPIVDAAGWVDIHKYTLQHNKYPNIFALGDCSSLPTSKTAAAITSQTHVVKHNLHQFLKGHDLTHHYDGYTSCPIPTGRGKLVLAEFDYDKRPLETFNDIYDQRKENAGAYLLKEKAFPMIYWKYLILGFWEGPRHLKSFMKNLLTQKFLKR